MLPNFTTIHIDLGLRKIIDLKGEKYTGIKITLNALYSRMNKKNIRHIHKRSTLNLAMSALNVEKLFLSNELEHQ